MTFNRVHFVLDRRVEELDEPDFRVDHIHAIIQGADLALDDDHVVIDSVDHADKVDDGRLELGLEVEEGTHLRLQIEELGVRSIELDLDQINFVRERRALLVDDVDHVLNVLFHLIERVRDLGRQGLDQGEQLLILLLGQGLVLGKVDHKLTHENVQIGDLGFGNGPIGEQEVECIRVVDFVLIEGRLQRLHLGEQLVKFNRELLLGDLELGQGGVNGGQVDRAYFVLQIRGIELQVRDIS